MSQVMFYEKPIALDREAHRSVRIGAMPDYLFAAKTNSVLLAGVEFAEAAKEYPVVFAKAAEGKFVPVALLGMRDNENLYVDENGKWNARYIPAFVRRYPFVLADNGTDQLTLCIDESSPAFNAENGQPLFDENGANTPFLQQALDFVADYQGQNARTEAFTSRLNELGLLIELSAKADMNDGSSYVINGLMVVDEQKLLALDSAKVDELFKSGMLGWIYAHLMSLSNMPRLIELIAQRKPKDLH